MNPRMVLDDVVVARPRLRASHPDRAFRQEPHQGGDGNGGRPRTAWGNRYFYETEEDRWVLVSYGLGWLSDGLDYWALRDRQSFERASRSLGHTEIICGHYFHDTVITDVGEVQICGK